MICHLCLLLLAIVGGVSADEESIRIMPLGDMFTVGSQNVEGGYRTALYNSLTGLGYNIDFVGSRNSPNIFLVVLTERLYILTIVLQTS